MRQLEAFYFEHQNDGRAILFEKQRMKLRGVMQPAAGSPPKPRRRSMFPEYWVPLRDGRSVPEIHTEVARARFMTRGAYRLLASANFGELVFGCIEAKFCK